MAATDKIIGIDLGTTNSVVAVMEGGEAKVIPNRDGHRLTPSVVAFTEGGERLVGQLARRQAVTNPRNTVFSIKRFMGRRHSEVAQEEQMVPYGITGDAEELVSVQIRDKKYTPPEISAMILRYLKESAEDFLGAEVTRAVITVPAYFNDSQRQATKDAGKIAGLTVERIINEPTAAALAYGLDKKKNEKIAVYDLGGGTFDISILEVVGDEDGEDRVVEVLATNGDTHLGGDNFDDVIINFIADEFKREHGIDLRQDQMALQRLKDEAEKAKCALSTSMSVDINLPFITADQTGPKHLAMSLSRAKLEQLVEKLVDKTRGPCERAMRDAKLTAKDIDEVILVGGMTRMPLVQASVKEFFGKDPHRGVNPDEVVAVGAAIQGGVLTQDVTGILLLDVTPLSLGIETEGGLMTVLIERNTTIPTEKKQIFSTAADGQTAVDIHVLQGERKMAGDNRTLGKFQLHGLPPAPRGMPQIEVAFDIDENGILNVSAKDLGTGKEQSIEIKSSSGLSDDEIERMVEEAKEHAAEDEKRRSIVEKRNQADTVCYQTEKLVKEHAEKLPDDDKKAIEDAIAEVRKVKNGEDAAAIDAAMEKLKQASYKISEILYKQNAAEAGAAGEPEAQAGGPKPGADDDVIDADYEVKD